MARAKVPSLFAGLRPRVSSDRHGLKSKVVARLKSYRLMSILIIFALKTSHFLRVKVEMSENFENDFTSIN